MAKLEDIQTAHAKDFEGEGSISDAYAKVNDKLAGLGYEVLINEKAKAEFVPASRLGDVVKQRDGFKVQVDTLNANLEALKKSADSDTTKAELQKMIDSNNTLLEQIEQEKIKNAVIVGAKDAIDASDILAFINMDKVKISSKGEVVGIDAEVERIRAAKPHLFIKAKAGAGGTDSGSGASGGEKFSMNSAIRKAAGRTF